MDEEIYRHLLVWLVAFLIYNNTIPLFFLGLKKLLRVCKMRKIKVSTERAFFIELKSFSAKDKSQQLE